MSDSDFTAIRVDDFVPNDFVRSGIVATLAQHIGLEPPQQVVRRVLRESQHMIDAAQCELLSNLVDDALNQAAAWSRRIPSLKMTPWMTSGSSFAPSSSRQRRSAL